MNLSKFKNLDNALRKVNNTARDGRRDVGRYGIALKGIGSNLVGALGIVGGVQLFAQGLKETFNIVKNFSKEHLQISFLMYIQPSQILKICSIEVSFHNFQKL